MARRIQRPDSFARAESLIAARGRDPHGAFAADLRDRGVHAVDIREIVARAAYRAAVEQDVARAADEVRGVGDGAENASRPLVGHDVEADHRNVVRTDAEDAAAQRVMDRHLLDAGLPAVDDFDTVGDVASVEKDDDGSRGGFHGRAVVETHPVVPQVGDPGPEHVAAQRYVACLVEQFVRRAVVEVRVFGDDPLQAVFAHESERVACHDDRDSVRRRSPYLNRCPLPRRSVACEL